MGFPLTRTLLKTEVHACNIKFYCIGKRFLRSPISPDVFNNFILWDEREAEMGMPVDSPAQYAPVPFGSPLRCTPVARIGPSCQLHQSIHFNP